MATSKLLRPTNVTISIPAFTDQPDQRVNSNCIDKEADAINTLSEQIGNVHIWSDDAQSPAVNRSCNANTVATYDITVPAASYGYIVGFAIESNTDIVMMQCYMTSKTNIHLRVRNVTSAGGSFQFRAYYI